MAQKTASLLPSTDALLRQFGDRLRLARQRRRLSAKQVAERAGMSPMTLRSLERGGSGVTMGAYLAVMQVLGVETDLDLLAKADPLGRELQDAQLPISSKAAASSPAAPFRPTRSGLYEPVGDANAKLHRLIKNTPQEQLRRAVDSIPGEQLRKTMEKLEASNRHIETLRKSREVKQDWLSAGGFSSSDALAAMLDPIASLPKKTR